MSDNINSMNFKQLKNEVQSLRDELAIMKRKYEDIIYNLDDDNFSSRFVKEKGDMKTAIEITAEGIKTKVSNEEFESTIKQTADAIRSEVKSATETLDGKFKNYSSIEQTDNKISLSVKETKEYTEEYITDTLANGGYVTNTTFKSQFDIQAQGIYATVEANYNDLSGDISSLSSSVSSIRQTANSISTRVGNVEDGQFGEHTLFEQTAGTFYFDGNQTVYTGCIWLTNNAKEKRFSISHDESNPATPFIQLYNPYDPLIIGRNQTSVYIASSNTSDNLIATRGWVLANAGSGGTGGYAVFG